MCIATAGRSLSVLATKGGAFAEGRPTLEVEIATVGDVVVIVDRGRDVGADVVTEGDDECSGGATKNCVVDGVVVVIVDVVTVVVVSVMVVWVIVVTVVLVTVEEVRVMLVSVVSVIVVWVVVVSVVVVAVDVVLFW